MLGFKEALKKTPLFAGFVLKKPYFEEVNNQKKMSFIPKPAPPAVQSSIKNKNNSNWGSLT